jgi:hypothetical protein
MIGIYAPVYSFPLRGSLRQDEAEQMSLFEQDKHPLFNSKMCSSAVDPSAAYDFIEEEKINFILADSECGPNLAKNLLSGQTKRAEVLFQGKREILIHILKDFNHP